LPWALAIAAWECRTIARKRGRRREVAEQGIGDAASAHAEHALVQRDLTEAAVAALGTLSDADRETLLATFWDEAAPASGTTLRKRRQRALQRLRKVFRRLYGLD
jgi:RNA polymerase sigma-70 factor (ECF subfamily)